MGCLVTGMLRVCVAMGTTMGVTVAVQALGAFRTVKIMPLAGTETEGYQDGE